MASTTHILLVDDEPINSGITKEYLEAKGFTVILMNNADAGLKAFKEDTFDLCVFDVKMPFKDGFILAEEVRELDKNVPIIFLTGQNQQENRIKGLTLGADDYITKPFSMQELFLRIQIVLKRHGSFEKNEVTKFTLGAYKYDGISRTLTHSHENQRLSEMEGQLLSMFCLNQEGRLTRDQALKEIWHDEDHMKSRSLNVYINKLRKRLAKDPLIEILNLHGTGYQLIIKES